MKFFAHNEFVARIVDPSLSIFPGSMIRLLFEVAWIEDPGYIRRCKNTPRSSIQDTD